MSFDRSAMDRLHEKGLISDPATKAKSVIPTGTGGHAPRTRRDRTQT